MTKKLCLALLCAATAIGALAQEKKYEERYEEIILDPHKIETNYFLDNWFVSAGGGALVYFGDHDKQLKLGDRLAPALDIAIGKWFSPSIAVRLAYSGLQAKGATQSDIHSTGKPVPGKDGPGYWLKYSKFNFWNLHADVMLDMVDIIAGYNPNRKISISPYLGVGWAHVYDKPTTSEVSLNAGIFASLHVSRHFDINLDLHGMLVNDRFSGDTGGRIDEGLFAATLGFSYMFRGEHSWNTRRIVRYEKYDLTEINNRINEMTVENQRLKEAIQECEAIVNPSDAASASTSNAEIRNIVKRIAAANFVTFAINKAKLTNQSRVNLGFLAEMINNNDPDLVYEITGYADKGTGSAEGNVKLSRERAEAVYNCLVKEFHVNPKQLRINYKGGVDDMFYNDPRMSRAVITRIVE